MIIIILNRDSKLNIEAVLTKGIDFIKNNNKNVLLILNFELIYNKVPINKTRINNDIALIKIKDFKGDVIQF